jgi:hypothetical protein
MYQISRPHDDSIVFLMIVLCSTALFVRAQDSSDSAVRSNIIALEKAWNQAYKAGDIRALDSILNKEISS